ncbi:MAG: pantoate--beta-alanine ligase, partial [Herbiconiux sp.]|nr:pantoate--beta-alanine ligase [Herbiconiux sp.]
MSHPLPAEVASTVVPRVVTTIAEVRREIDLIAAGVDPASATDRVRVALVPTMGALHAGHLALVDRAAEIADVVVVSVFVNPLQFTDPADLDRYPRDLEGDLRTLAGHGADLVFAPEVDELYPRGDTATRVTAGRVGSLFEGRSRP